MTKKKITTKVEEPIVEETIAVEEQIKVEAPKIKAKSNNNWEIKDRVYYLKSKRKPLSHSIRSSNLFWFDEQKGYEREIKYCQNQRTVFVDEMKGEQRLEHIVFRNGALFVEKEKTILQKFLSLYHPHNGKLFYEHKPVEVAENQIDRLEMEADAILLARQLDIDMAEAIMRVEKGSEVSNMSSKELKRDAYKFAQSDPKLFIELSKDEDIKLRNLANRAVELGILNLTDDNTVFKLANGKKVMTVPFDQHPYAALAAYFKTDEGVDLMKSIMKKIS